MKNKGITLITLVITIIVLLILAGITIATLFGKDGLLTRARKTKELEIETEMKEELILAIHDLQIEKKSQATIEDVTQEWLDKQIKKYECTIKEKSTNEKMVTMNKHNVIFKFLINKNLNVEEQNNSNNVELKFDIVSRNANSAEISIKIKDDETGLKQIENPDGSILDCEGKNEIGIDMKVEADKEYKFKITSQNGQQFEKTVFIEALTELIPKMNSDSQDGVTVSVSDYYGQYTAYKGVDRDNTTVWTTASGNYNEHWFLIEFDTKRIVKAYNLIGMHSWGVAQTFYIQASNDNINWKNIEGEIKHKGLNGNSGLEINVVVPNNEAFKYYRMYCEKGSGWTYGTSGGGYIYELQLYGK